MPFDEVSYVNALLWHMQRPRVAAAHVGVGYSALETQMFLRVTEVFTDVWAARIWFEFGRIDPATELTPILACQQGMTSRVDDALATYLSTPLPVPVDGHDPATLGHWLCCAGAGPRG